MVDRKAEEIGHSTEKSEPMRMLQAAISDAYNEGNLMTHVVASSPMELVLRGHLWVEGLLEELIEESLQRPQALNIRRMNFSSKAAMVDALGLLEPEQELSIRALNKLRNALAHERDREVLLSDQEELLRLMPTAPEVHEWKRDQFPDGFRIAVLWIVGGLVAVRLVLRSMGYPTWRLYLYGSNEEARQAVSMRESREKNQQPEA